MGIYGEYSAWEYPFYSLYNASKFLRIPYSTLRGWIKDGKYCVLSASDDDGYLNFWDLSSVFVIRHMRENMGIPLSSIRNASRCLRSKGKYSLIQKEVLTGENDLMREGRDILLRDAEVGTEEFNALIRQCLDRIDFGENRLPEALYPWREGEEGKEVRIDPRIRFGEPVVSGTRIPVFSVQDRVLAGEREEDVATSYGISETQVACALDYANSL